MTIKSFIKKTGKVILYLFCFILFIVIAAIIFINTGYGKRLIRDKAQAYLQNKIKTKVVIGSIDFSLPKWIEIKNVYIEDQQKDTLLYGEKLAVDMSMLKLIHGDIYIQKIELDSIKANISRTATDSDYNFQYIINAFSDTISKPGKKADTSAMKITLKELALNNFILQYKDNYGGNILSANIKNIDISIDKFQPSWMLFAINQFKADGFDFSMVSFKTPNSSLQTKPDTSSKTNLFFTAKKLDLRNINVSMNDKDNGMVYENHFQNFVVINTDVNLAAQKINFDRIKLDSSSVKFVLPKSDQTKAVDTTTNSSASWMVRVKSIQLNNDEVQLDNNQITPAKEGLDPAHIDAKNITINAGDIFYSTDSTKAIINQFAFNEKSGFKLDTTHARILYSSKGIAAAELYVRTPQSLLQNSIEVRYDDISQLTTHPKNTFISANLLRTTIAVNDIYTLMPSVEKYMPKDKFQNNTINLTTQISGTLQQLNIPVLQVNAFSGSTIKAKAVLYNITDTKNIGYDITVYNSHIPKNDILKFMQANQYINKLPPVIDFSTHLKGNLKNTTADININSDALKINGKATINNIDNPNALKFNVAITNSMVTKDFITALVPAKSLPSSIQLPGIISLSGKAKGDMNNIEPDLILGGSYGTMTAKGYVHNFKNQETAKYDIQFTANNFAAGKLLKQPDSVLGNISLSAGAKGEGFNYKTMHSSITMQVQSAAIKNYDYQNIDVDADLDGGNISTNGSINSPAIKMQYQLAANVSGEYPSAVEATISLDTLLLQQLDLYTDTLNAAFRAHIKGTDLDPKNLNFYALLDSIKLNVKNHPYSLDSISLNAATDNGVHNIVFKSQLADVNAKGSFDYDKIGQSVLQYVDKYYNVMTVSPEKLPEQEIALDGVIKNSPMITGLMPGLVYDDIHFKGGYSSKGGDSALNLHITMPKFTYQTYDIDNGKIDITSLNSEIDYALIFNVLHLNKNIFYASSIKGDVANDSLNIIALTKDIKNKDRFIIGANITDRDKSYTVSLKKNLLLNYQKWNVAEDNKISYSPDGILVKDFVIDNDKSKISVNSRENILNSPIDIDIDSFSIKDISSIANSDTLLASGIINSKIEVSNFKDSLPEFTGDISISQLNFMQQPVGDIKITAKEQDENTVNATLNLTGDGNNVNAKGSYYLNNAQNQFDVNLTIDTLKMRTLQAFTAGNMSRSAGDVNGKIAINGNLSEPKWNGDINFDSAKFTVAKTGAAYLIDKQKIALNYPTITFSQFTIQDSLQNELSFDGTITAQSLSSYDMNVDINADQFIVVNTSRAIDNQVYGYATTNTNINVSGNSSAPIIDGDIALNPKSDVTIVLPEQNINKDAALSVVRFIDRDTFALPEKVAFAPADTAKENISGFLNYNLNISISKEAALTVVVDPSSGDVLKVQGEAQLNAGVDPGGNIVLAGNYSLDSGSYVLNYQFLQKQFNLVKGSTIAFGGNPMDAQINITADYIINTSASDLLDNEISSMDPKTANTFNQKIPFHVLLYLKGTMKKPDISFDIQLPDQNANIAISNDIRSTIENKLVQMRSDVAETNKEVFSLLLLGRFVGEQSSDFFKSNGNSTSLNEVARESVSKFLSSAMNEIASDLFKGVDVDLNLNSYQDYSTGNEEDRTDLDVAVSKNFLNDRLTITAGKNFGVSGEDAAAKAVEQNSTTSSFPDVTVNYKLSKDGKYAMKAYKKDQFEITVDGYVTETGVGFILTMDYDTFKELFHPKKKNKTSNNNK